MHILISGGTGFIGSHLAKALCERGDSVYLLSRRPGSERQGARIITDLDQLPQVPDVVVNLAGAPIVDRRWSEARKQLLRSSRLDTTRRLVQWMASLEQRPRVLISGSAIGYYGSQRRTGVDEASPVKAGFTHQLCADWEAEACEAEKLGVRVCCIRTGVVLGQGGALQKMLPAFRFGLGGPIASGTQWMSWVHIEDEVGAILWLIDHDQLKGAFNLTAPEPVTNQVFSRTLGEVLHRPACLRMPAWVMTLMLGEASELLVEGAAVLPRRLQESGYEFRFPTLKPALEAVLNH